MTPAPILPLIVGHGSAGHEAEGDVVDRDGRERDFWGHHIPSLEACLAEFRAGPDANTAAMIGAVEPLAGARVLDFACGGGVTSAWLARRGAVVTGVDISPESVARARQVHAALGLNATFVTSLDEADERAPFDALVGRYALHHTDVSEIAPLLARRLRPGGAGAFVETFVTNPVLRVARRTLPGRLGISKLGTDDEQPLRRQDLDALHTAFGTMDVRCAEMACFRIFDRQVLGFRYPAASAAFRWADDRIRSLPRSTPLSYIQVVVVHKTAG